MAVLGPQINEANYIATTLMKNVTFKPAMVMIGGTNKLTIVVSNRDITQSYNWNPEKFRLRLVLFREMLDDLLDDGILQKFRDPKKDPFWDPEKESQNPYPEEKT